MRDFWEVIPCSLTQMYRLFRGIRWVEQEIPDYMALLLRRQCSSQLLPWKLQSDIKIITVMGMEYGGDLPMSHASCLYLQGKI